MKIKAKYLKIRSGNLYDDAGQRIEAEQQPAVQVIESEAVTELQRGPVVGSIPMQIITETTAGEAAQIERFKCKGCKFFDPRAWAALRRKWDDPSAPMDERRQLNGIRAAILDTQDIKFFERHAGADGDMDVEHALSELGICQALSELRNGPTIVSKFGACPDETVTAAAPHGLYRPKDRTAEKMGSAAFDSVMKTALGRAP